MLSLLLIFQIDYIVCPNTDNAYVKLDNIAGLKLFSYRLFTVCQCQLTRLYILQTELCELREEVSELKSSRYKADTRLRQLELSICEKDSEISKANQELEEVNFVMQ